jgi:para-nitrobenzyl esterase
MQASVCVNRWAIDATTVREDETEMTLLRSSMWCGALTAGVISVAGCDLHPGKVPQIIDAKDATSVTVTTRSGPVVGAAAPLGKAFLGIPYAAPPIGALRWKPPQPVDTWTAPRNARTLGNACMQAIRANAASSGGGGGLPFGNEDCLYLNVYTPPGAPPAVGAWPVMAYLPGGAFVLGAGDNYDPSRLATEQHVIVVTINYRLGALGFLAHPALSAETPAGGSGNYGLLDQQAALRWVRDNIAGFGGDPRKVTLFGESAGAWSACYHMVSPGAAGLFHRVILQSGSCIDPVSLAAVADADAAGADFARAVDCPDADTALACLREVSARKLARTASTRRGLVGPASWGPVWGDGVVPLRPADAFERGRYLQVPAIVGTTRDEGRLFAIATRDQASFEARIGEQYGAQAPEILARYTKATQGSARLAYAAVWTDARLACPSDALRQALRARSEVYGYEFADDRAPIRLPSMMQGGPMGAYHSSELAYVFGTRWALADPANFDVAQRALSQAMMTAWGRFAHGQAPAAGWPAFGDEGLVRSLAPGATRNVADFAQRHDCDFWTALFDQAFVARPAAAAVAR